jgi:hypothetical protein
MNRLLHKVINERCQGCRHYRDGPCEKIETASYVWAYDLPEGRRIVRESSGLLRPDCYDAPGIRRIRPEALTADGKERELEEL